jgi:protein subunit release factor B
MARQKLFSVTIKDCNVETFTVGGAGGGGKDTSNTGVRISHPPSGASGVGVDSRSQFKNKQDAFRRMAESKQFRAWVKLKAAELSTGKTVEQRVEEAMAPKNIKVEHRTKKGWRLAPTGKNGECLCGECVGDGFDMWNCNER